MYYYKSYYDDGTWDVIKSKTPIRTASRVCMTCYRVKIISMFSYYWHQLTAFLMYECLDK